MKFARSCGGVISLTMVAANYFCKQWKCFMPQPKTNGAGKLEVELGGKEEERDIQRGKSFAENFFNFLTIICC